MSATSAPVDGGLDPSADDSPDLPRRRSTETKAAYTATAFYAYVLFLLGVLTAADNIGGHLGGDNFRADEAWLYVTILTLGYMISRGLAKAGRREPHAAAPAPTDATAESGRAALTSTRKGNEHDGS
jgi:hypothetical protein